MKKNYKFSVIIPIYNVESYLEDTIESVINQTIGFKENIELILVNDGSPDNSNTICKKYLELYPENIKYIEQENAGVSEARNKGIKEATAKYINFLDGDDKWEKDAFEKAWNYFEKHYNEIDVVSCRQKFFEAKNAYQSLDYKYKDGNNIIDINTYPNYIQMSVASCFIKTETARKYSFDKRLKYGEDAKYITDIILEKEKYGILADALYLIRKRNEETSATQGKKYNSNSYMTTVQYYYQYIYDLSIKKYKKVIPYIQYALVNALKYRISTRIPKEVELTQKEKDEYKKTIVKLIKSIDDEIICNTNKVNIDTKLYMLEIKHNNIEKDVTLKEGTVYYKNIEVGKMKGTNNLYLTNFEIKNNECIITGLVKMTKYFKLKELFIDDIGKTYSFNLKECPESNRKSLLDEDVNYTTKFNASFAIDKGYNRYKFYIRYEDTIIPLTINYDESFKNTKYKNHISKDTIVIKRHYTYYLIKEKILKLLARCFK